MTMGLHSPDHSWAAAVARFSWFLALLVFVATLVVAQSAYPQDFVGRRVALVVGNGAYELAGGRLRNPPNDASAMAQKLETFGFEVIDAIDTDYRGMRSALQQFDRALQGAQMGLFFYAGHGMEYRGDNYLFPTDAVIETEGDVGLSLINMDQVMQVLETSVPVRIVLLDACRDNAIARRFRSNLGAVRSSSVGSGLGEMRAAVGTFIAYATAPGDVAMDGRGEHSPFTAALLSHLDEPGLDIAQLMRRVRASVLDATNERQVPWDASSLRGEAIILNRVDIYDSVPEPDRQTTPDPRAAEAALGLSSAAWERVQIELRALGYDIRVVNGRPGANTRTALRSWQRSKSMDVTGYLDERQYASLVVEAKQQRPTTRDLQPADRFRDCAACPKMVVVPAGSFLMGSPEDEEGRWENEGPQHRATIAEPVAIGVYEVTFDEWDACVAAGGCRGYRPDDEGWGRDRRPVIKVSWEDAQAYIEWLSGETGAAYRLLSEVEWEYAARAGTTTPFYFGSTISSDQANYDGNYIYGSGAKGVYREQTVPVGSFPPNDFGLHDVHGNVWEWVEDCLNNSYSGDQGNGATWASGDCDLRVLRGGSRFNSPGILRAANRGGSVPDIRGNFDVGFRVARTLR